MTPNKASDAYVGLEKKKASVTPTNDQTFLNINGGA